MCRKVSHANGHSILRYDKCSLQGPCEAVDCVSFPAFEKRWEEEFEPVAAEPEIVRGSRHAPRRRPVRYANGPARDDR